MSRSEGRIQDLSSDNTQKQKNIHFLDFSIIMGWIRALPIVPVMCLMPLFVFGTFGPLFYLHDPHIPNLAMALQAPGWMEGGSWSYPLGTDQLGRDLLSRLIEGARCSLLVAIFGVLLSGFIGVVLGMLAGFLGGKIDQLIMRIVDTWMAIPGVFFMLMLVALLRQSGITGLAPIIISLAITMWVPYARMVRGETLSLKQREFISLATVTGCSNRRESCGNIFSQVF